MLTKRSNIKIVCIVILALSFIGCATLSPLQKVAKKTLRKDSPASWVEYGRVCLHSNDMKEAEKSFRKAMELDEKYLPAYKHLAMMLMTKHRNQEAKETYEKALKFNEKNSELLAAYGYCLADLGDEEKALEAFKKAVEANTNSTSVISAHLGASGLLRKKGDKEGAKREYEAAVKINPEIAKILSKKQKSQTGEGTQTASTTKKEFEIDLWMDRDDATYKPGEKIKFFFKSNKDCYLTLLMVGEDGEVKTLYPNKHHKDNLVKAGSTFRIPKNKDRYVFRAKGSGGKHIVKAIAVQKEDDQDKSGNTGKKEVEKTLKISKERS